MRAVRNLLTGATKIQSNTPTRQFIKSGGYERALKDFREAAPKNIQTFETEFKVCYHCMERNISGHSAENFDNVHHGLHVGKTTID